MTTEKAEAKARNIYQRIAGVMADLEPVEKTGENKFQNYKFISAGMLFAVLQKKVAAAGIVVIPMMDPITLGPGTTSKGGEFITASLRFRVVNADNPEDFFEVPWQAQASAGDDKGANKCATSGMKYFLMRLFFVSDEDDPDAESGGGGPERLSHPPTPMEQRKQAQAQKSDAVQQRRPGLAVVRETVSIDELRGLVEKGLAQDTEAAGKLPKGAADMTEAELHKTLTWLVRRAKAVGS